MVAVVTFYRNKPKVTVTTCKWYKSCPESEFSPDSWIAEFCTVKLLRYCTKIVLEKSVPSFMKIHCNFGPVFLCQCISSHRIVVQIKSREDPI